MNYKILFFYLLITFSLAHLVWGFYDRYEKQSLCNVLMQTALIRENSELAQALSDNQEPGGVCHSSFTPFKFLTDVVVIGYAVYWLREDKSKIS